MAAEFGWLRIVGAVVDDPVAPHDPGLAQGADHADVIPDPAAGQRVSLGAKARVVPNLLDQNPVHDQRAVTLAKNPSPDPPARRRIPNPGLGHAPDPSPGMIRVDPEVSAKNVGTETREVVLKVQTKMAIGRQTDHRKRMMLAMINWVVDDGLLLESVKKKLFYFSFL
jgi:hypothetical protein